MFMVVRGRQDVPVVAYLWLAAFMGRSSLSGHGTQLHLKNVTVTAVSCRTVERSKSFWIGYPANIICDIHWFSEEALVFCFVFSPKAWCCCYPQAYHCNSSQFIGVAG